MNSAVYISKILITSTLTSALLLAGCGSDNNNSPSNQVSQSLITNTESYAPQQTTATTIVSDKITYKMPAIAGGQTTATAVVMIPKGTAPIGGWPIIVWAHGTTGVADKCAPSNLKDGNGKFTLGDNLPLVNLLLSQGYAVVSPDYEGLGSPGIHPFLNAQSEGESIIYALKAAKQQYNNQLSKDWVVVGHSQGGHAAIAAAERANEATGLNFKGLLAYAPASHLKEIFAMGQTKAQGYINQGDFPNAISTLASIETFSSLVTAGVRQTSPNFKYTDVFGARSAPIAQKAENDLCSGDLGLTFGADIQNYFQTNGITNPYPGLISNFDTVSEIKTFLAASVIGNKAITQPIVIVQGDLDPTVPIEATKALEQQIKAKNSSNPNIQFNYVVGKNHITVITEGTNYLINFLNTYLPTK